jgi:crotonobetainyl-CoA:carnitine CoA-transferase CaiB-like acyl-CoA transferase
MSYDAPFAGLKVVDLSQGVAGPYCGMLLAQHGADVIKVEPTGEGDWSRTLGRRYAGHTAYSIPTNLGKRSIALDLKSPAGKEVLWRLIAGADVLLEGFRPGVLDRLGFGYEAVSKREPRILYLSVSGFGQTGPSSGRPAMDPVLQAFTGLMMDNRGEDQVIRMMMVYLEGEQVRRAMPSGVFKTADGWLQFLVVRNDSWVRFCNVVLGRPELVTDARFVDDDARMRNEAELMAIVRPAIAEKPTAYWSERLREADIMHERLNSFREFLRQPQAEAISLVSWLEPAGTPEPVPVPNIAGIAPFANGTTRATAPLLGQHTAEVLRDHGFTPADIASLVECKIVSQAKM